MKLVTFRSEGAAGIGILRAEGVIDLASDPSLPTDMSSFIGLGSEGIERARAISAEPIPMSSVTLLAPLTPPNNVICVGKNYLAHAREFSRSGFDASQQQAVPDHPVIFTKARSSIVGPNDPVTISADTTRTSDYEGELAVVIGPGGKDIPAADAWAHVYGYTILNDMTVREKQKQHVQFFLGKSAPTYCPMGPCLVTADEIANVEALRVRTTVNDEVRQESAVADLIFDIPTLIEVISAAVLLEPGDVIATGTPAGVGLGFTPPKFLVPGDEVTITINGIGTLSNPMA